MSCPRCGADDIWAEWIYCEKCEKLIRMVCTACHETLAEKPCDCTREVDISQDSAS